MSTLKIHLTYQCSAQCAHCHLRAGRWPAPAIDHDLAMATITELQRLNGLEQVVLLGGEPGLVSQLTHRLVAGIHRLGLKSRVETNASWATNEASARAFLEPLCAAGTEVMLSVDAFHEPYVPLVRVERAIRVLDALGGRYVLEVPYLDYPAAQHALDMRTDALLAALEGSLGRSPCGPTYRGPVFFKGRAAHVLAPLVAEGRGVPAAVCDTVPWWANGSQRTAQLLGLDPEGYLSKECGIALGNVRERPVGDILAGFDADAHAILGALIREGPLGLAREAAEFGYALKPDYADKCHLCQEAREALQPRYPEFLAPASHYVEGPPSGA